MNALNSEYTILKYCDLDPSDEDKILKGLDPKGNDIVIAVQRYKILDMVQNIVFKMAFSIKSKYIKGCVYCVPNKYNIKNNIKEGDLINELSRITRSGVNIRYVFIDRYVKTRHHIFGDLKSILLNGNIGKYLIVGISGVAVNEGVLLLTDPYLGKIYSIIPAIELSIIYNFLLNNFITFRGGFSRILIRLGKYNVFNLIGFGVNSLIYYFLVSRNINIYASDFIGIIIAFIITYTTAATLVW
ncbi:GtrA family protein [Picrophilus oshimae]|uniref:GtrA family protein n=1 Tax=Picrophilus oshimae TaxID=46632 RepID=UPI0006913145|nr:GtrA family protein [Picrophilus oshimae]